jgi:hypothetical protein
MRRFRSFAEPRSNREVRLKWDLHGDVNGCRGLTADRFDKESVAVEFVPVAFALSPIAVATNPIPVALSPTVLASLPVAFEVPTLGGRRGKIIILLPEAAGSPRREPSSMLIAI